MLNVYYCESLSYSVKSGKNTMSNANINLRQAVRAFTLNYGDPIKHLNSLLEQDPNNNIAVLLKAWMLVLSNDGPSLAKARKLVRSDNRQVDSKGKWSSKSARISIKHQWPSAVAVLDRHLMEDPRSNRSPMCTAVRWLSGAISSRSRKSGEGASFLVKEDPDYGIMLFYGFGLEELGDFSRAEDIAEAAELEPYGYWPHHAVSHVMEMTGRPQEGLKWMDSREALWNGANCNNRVHIWWHKALFFIELGQFDQALAIYDDEILPVMRPVATQLAIQQPCFGVWSCSG